MKELEKGNFPKIYTVLTNFSPLVGHEEPQQTDDAEDFGMDYGAEDTTTVPKKTISGEEWYEQLKKEYIKGVSDCVLELFQSSAGV